MSSVFYNGLPDLCGSKSFSNGTSWMDFPRQSSIRFWTQ